MLINTPVARTGVNGEGLAPTEERIILMEVAPARAFVKIFQAFSIGTEKRLKITQKQWLRARSERASTTAADTVDESKASGNPPARILPETLAQQVLKNQRINLSP
ncbi:MAG: hypothetical protein ACJAYC_002207 [Halieaceae bacterium]